MFGMVIAAIAGAVIGGAVNGVVAAKSTEEKVNAYKQAAKDVKSAANKYSGENAYKSMVNQGQNYMGQDARSMANEMAAASYQPTGPGVTGTAQANALGAVNRAANATNEAALGGFSTGMSDAAASNAAKYNAATVQAQQLMNQADINYNVANQAAQGIMQGIGDTANTFNSLRRTNNGRTYAGQGK